MSQSQTQVEHAEWLHKDSIIINSLNSTRFHAFSAEHVEKLRKGGWAACNVTVSHPTSLLPTLIYEPDFKRAIQDMYLWLGRLYEIGYDKLLVVRQASDIRKAKQEGKIGIILGYQSGNQFEELGHPTIFHRIGMRISALSYMYGNIIADGPLEPRNAGLTSYGEKLVEQFNNLGIVIDLSHVGEQSAKDVIKISKDPPILSHSGPKALVDVPRNASDELMQALAEKGGVVGLTAIKWLLIGNKRNYLDFPVTCDDMVKHIQYVVDLIGVDHVCVGLDIGDTHRRTDETARFAVRYPGLRKTGYIPSPGPPSQRYVPELIDPSSGVELTKALVRGGFSDDEIRKILGLNILKLFERVWKDTNYAPPPIHLASVNNEVAPPS